MPAAKTLASLLTDLRAELGHASAAGTGTAAEANLKYVLRRAQEMLWAEFEWPSKFGHAHISPHTGANFYTIPTGFGADGIRALYLRDGNDLKRLEWGIPIRDRMESDYDLVPILDASWPPTHWAIWTYAPPLPSTIYYDSSTKVSPEDGDPFDYGTQLIEIFPVPLFTGVQTDNLVIAGTRSLPDLSADTDYCVLDPVLIVLRAAAEIALRTGAKDAQLKLQASNVYANRLLKNMNKDSGMFVMGGGKDPNQSILYPHGPDFSFLQR